MTQPTAPTRAAPRIYLAGPGVFFENPQRHAESLKALCRRHGLAGVFPLDGDLALQDKTAAEAAAMIRAANCALIRDCAGLLADIRPFRGPGMDAGTAFEIGFAAALGQPVVCYSEDRRPYFDRVAASEHLQRDAAGRWRDARGWEVEAFGLAENLMIAADTPVCFGVEEAVQTLARLLAGTI